MSGKKQSGFTLMEILIAVAILAVGVVAVVNLFPVGLRAARRTANFSDAAVLAQKAMEFYRSEGYEYVDGMYDPLPAGAWKDVGGTEDVYIPAPANTDELERGGGMEDSEPFEDNPDYSWRIVISDDIEDAGGFHGADAEIYKLTLYIYWLDRGQEQFDEFSTLIANYE